MLDIPGSAKEALGTLQGICIDATGQHLARGRDHRVVGPAQTRDRIEQDHDIAAVLHQAFGFFDHHFSDLDVTRCRLVKGRGNHLTLHGTLHVSHFFRPLIDQQDHQITIRMIALDGMGDVLQQHGFTGPRRRHDQSALALAERRDDIDDPTGTIFHGRIGQLHIEAAFRIKRGQIVKVNLVTSRFRILEINRRDFQQRKIAFAIAWTADLAFDRITRTQPELPDLGRRHIDIVRSGQIV